VPKFNILDPKLFQIKTIEECGFTTINGSMFLMQLWVTSIEINSKGNHERNFEDFFHG
tara:strand:+ start:70 stop:243 length:174 start_codon:yes stop_codon:yes gene_type:complete